MWEEFKKFWSDADKERHMNIKFSIDKTSAKHSANNMEEIKSMMETMFSAGMMTFAEAAEESINTVITSKMAQYKPANTNASNSTEQESWSTNSRRRPARSRRSSGPTTAEPSQAATAARATATTNQEHNQASAHTAGRCIKGLRKRVAPPSTESTQSCATKHQRRGNGTTPSRLTRPNEG